MKEKEDTTKMGKVKYSPEMKEQTVKYILEGGKSASKVAVELGIDKNTICRWVREYRKAHQMPTYEVERECTKQCLKKRYCQFNERSRMSIRQFMYGKFFCQFKEGVDLSQKICYNDEGKTDVFRYIELFYNRKRLHSSPGF